jgi:predicted component of type VI protein secretion system
MPCDQELFDIIGQADQMIDFVDDFLQLSFHHLFPLLAAVSSRAATFHRAVSSWVAAGGEHSAAALPWVRSFPRLANPKLKQMPPRPLRRRRQQRH